LSIKVGEKGQPARIATNFDMSGSTGLTIKFIPPSTGGTEFTVTEVSGSPVTAPAVPLTNDPELGNRAASTYFEYITTGLEFDAPGDWTACGLYQDATRDLEANQTIFPIDASCF